MKTKYLLMAALALPCVMFTACGTDDPVTVEPGEQPITNNVDAEKYIDASYSPSLSDIQKSWTGEYEGWDAKQASSGHVGNTKIKRLLTLLPNNHYVNIIQGVILDGKGDYVDFEREHGTYSYNTRTLTITYTVQSDSILDYSKQKFDVYSKKKYYDHQEGNYTEKVSFSVMKDNQRAWITRDTYLQSLTDKTINIAFSMVQKADKEERK